MKKATALLLSLLLIGTLFVGCADTPPANPPAETPTVETPPTNTAPPDDTSPDNGSEDGDDIGSPSVEDTLPADTINAVTDWGLSSDAGKGIQNGLLLYQKISDLKNGATVFFPEGTYELDLPLLLNGKKNIRLVGKNAVLINTRATNTTATQEASTDPAIPLSLRAATATSGMVWIEGSEKITLEGLTFGYKTPTSISGKVISRSTSYVDVEVTDGSPITGNEYVMAINTFTSDGIPNRVSEQYASTCFPVEKRSDTVLRVSGLNGSAIPNNTRIALRMSLSSNYVCTAFNSSDLVFRNLTFRNSLNGAVLIEHRTVNATFDGVTVKSDNPNALFSLNADALHLTGLGGELMIKNCDFERGGDDFLNTSGAAAKITSISGTTLSVTLSWGADSRWAAVGDEIEFFNPSTFASLGTARITRANGLNLTFDTLPSGVTTSTILSNKTLHPKVTVEHSSFRYNRARALLIQTDDVTIRNCEFFGTSLSAILAAPDYANLSGGNNWMELSPTRSISITNCTFKKCGANARAVIQFAVDHDNLTTSAPAPIHTDITVANNTFSAAVPALFAISCKNLTFRDNNTADISASKVLVLYTCVTVTYDAGLASSGKVESTATTGVTTA